MELKRVALIAHDGKKDDLVDFVKAHQAWFKTLELVGTGTTGGRVAELGLSVRRLASGPLGGDAQSQPSSPKAFSTRWSSSATRWANIPTNRT